MQLIFKNGGMRLAHRQQGMLTIFGAVIALFLLTVLMLYSSRSSIFDQRVSANVQRNTVAFNLAESMVDLGTETVLAYGSQVISATGWRAASADGGHWVACTDAKAYCTTDLPSQTWNDTPGFYLHDLGTALTEVGAAIDDLEANAENATGRISMAFQFIDDTGTVIGEPDPDEEETARAVFMIYGYGFADCTDVNDHTTCQAESRIAKPLGTIKTLSGSPAVPLVTKNVFPPTGTAELVGNPNGGGVGVLASAWMNDNNACPPDSAITSSGSWQTCQLFEWYNVPDYPEGVACTDNNCQCGFGGNDTSEFESYKNAGSTEVGIDMISDPAFPCDLFDYYFGVPRANYQAIKDSAIVLSDCSSLDANSTGFYWISGASCNLGGNTQFGSATNPLIVISAASETTLNGGVEFFGVLYIFDGEDANAEIASTGSATVYGSAIVDASIDRFQGTFQVVYSPTLIGDAQGIGGVGAVDGGWRDFDIPAFSN